MTNNPVANTRADQHFTVGNTYLTYVDTDAVSNYSVVSVDETAVGRLKAQITANGNYTITQHNANGHSTEIQDGGKKLAADSHTVTIGGHIDQAADGGQRSNFQNGMHTESGHAATEAANDSKINAMKKSVMHLSQGGSGHHVVIGEQSFMVKEGGEHHAIDKDYSLTVKASAHFHAVGEYSVFTEGNSGFTSGGSTSLYAGKSITITANDTITLTVGGSSIQITASGINITTSGPVNINGSVTNCQGGGSSIPPWTCP